MQTGEPPMGAHGLPPDLSEPLLIAEQVAQATSPAATPEAPTAAAASSTEGLRGLGTSNAGTQTQPDAVLGARVQVPPQLAGPDTARIVADGQWFCSIVLLISCSVAAFMIVREALQGLQRSFMCNLTSGRQAPLACAIPLASAAVVCHFAVVAGLFCVARFAWRSGFNGGGFTNVEQQRVALRSDLKVWRNVTAKILLATGATYVVAGTPCAGVARLAFLFLATGFLTLYATALFFDDDFEQVRMSPRLLRFLVVYLLVGFTFSTLTAGITEWSRGVPHNGTGVAAFDKEQMPTSSGRSPFANVCDESTLPFIVPSRCAIPLDLAEAVCFWWAASPLFAPLVPAVPACHLQGRTGGDCRRALQRWRRRIDLILLFGVMLLLLLLQSPCQVLAPMAFSNAEFGIGLVGLWAVLRRAAPLACDGWRGPLEHLVSVSDQFSVTSCAVCLMDLTRGEDVCRTQCGHDFHRDCLEEWVLSRRARTPDCPLCREPLEPRERTGLSQFLLVGDCMI